jgi:hypothetical protein
MNWNGMEVIKMTLDEVIKYSKEAAVEKEAMVFKNEDALKKSIAEYEECANKHKRLAGWLKELKSYIDRDTEEPVHYYDRMSRAECPSCGHKMYDDDATWKCDYCCNCGKKLRW